MLRRKTAYAVLEKALGYRFRHADLLSAALLHRSYRYESAGQAETDNERLEFLGDAVLGMLACTYLYRRHPDDDEGRLTAYKSRAISGRLLSECAVSVGLGEHLRMGNGELRSGGRARMSNLGDAMEAVLGAAYLDGGLRAAEKIFTRVIEPRVAELDADVHSDNPKGRLQEYLQANWKCGPHYRVISREGPEHEALFTVEATAPEGSTAIGTGRNKQEAERTAAEALYRVLKTGVGGG